MALQGDPDVDGAFLNMNIWGEGPSSRRASQGKKILSWGPGVADGKSLSPTNGHDLPRRRDTPCHLEPPRCLPNNDEAGHQEVPLQQDPARAPPRSKGFSFRRAECRFSVPGTIWFCGVATNDVHVSTGECKVEPIRGRNRSALQLLLNQAKDLIMQVHQEPRFTGPSSAAGAMPGILAGLGTELSVCFQSLSDASYIDTIDNVPAVLVILSHFIEVLDTLIPIEDLGLDPAITTASGGGEATPTFTEEVMQALRQVFGVNGFLPQCLACLGDAKLWNWLLHAAGARDFAQELRFHLILLLRLTMAWDAPRGIPRHAEVMLDSCGLEVLCDVVTDLGRSQQTESCDTDAPPKAAQLGLAFDSLRLLLRLSLRWGDCSLRSPCRSKKGMSRLMSRGSRMSAAGTVSKLASKAVQAIEEILREQTPGLEEAVDAAVPATVRFLAFLMEVPPVAEDIDKDKLARAIVQSITARPLTLRLTVAVRELVVAPQHHRSSGSWMAWSTAPDKRAKALREELNECLHREKMPSRLAAKAKEHLQEVLEQKGEQQMMQASTTCLREKARMQYAEMMAVAAFYDNVEAITESICGTTQGVDLETLRGARDELGGGQEPELPGRRRKRTNSLSNAMNGLNDLLRTRAA